MSIPAALRRFALSGAICLIALLIACQGALASAAGLVIRHGDGGVTYALVVFPEAEISSFELLNRSTISLATVQFGGLGEAVCTLDGEGCGVSDCRKTLCQTGDPNSPFWQFFRQDRSGVWTSQPLGASASKVQDGDVDGWSWTGTSSSGLSMLTIDQIAARLDVDLGQIDDATTHAFVASFDADGNLREPANVSQLKRWSTLAGVAALVLLGAAGIFLHRRGARIE